jgi:hypothetical protein
VRVVCGSVDRPAIPWGWQAEPAGCGRRPRRARNAQPHFTVSCYCMGALRHDLTVYQSDSRSATPPSQISCSRENGRCVNRVKFPRAGRTGRHDRHRHRTVNNEGPQAVGRYSTECASVVRRKSYYCREWSGAGSGVHINNRHTLWIIRVRYYESTEAPEIPISPIVQHP